jgi:hypothetical protein
MKLERNNAANHKIISTFHSERFATSKHEIIAELNFMYKLYWELDTYYLCENVVFDIK